MPECPHMTDAEWLEAVRDAHKKRAEFYYRMFCEMRDEFGEEKALDVMSRACRKIGNRQGEEDYGPKMKDKTPAAFCDCFCGKGGVGVKLFEIEAGPVAEEDGEDVAYAHLGRCALVEGWQAMGVPDADIAKLCGAAREVDYGKLDPLGLEGEFPELLSEGGEKCCFRIRRKKNT